MIINGCKCVGLRTPKIISLFIFGCILFSIAGCTNNLSSTGAFSLTDDAALFWTIEGGNPQRSRVASSTIEPPLSLKATFEVGRETRLVSPPVVGQSLVVADSDKRLSGFGLDSGVEEWFINLAGSYLSPVIAEELVLVRAEANDEGYLIALNGDAATIAWEFQFPIVGSGARKLGGHVTAPLALGPYVFTGASRSMFALSIEDGSQIWSFKTEEPLASAASADGELLYFADFANLYAVEFDNGGEAWRFAFEDTTSLLFAPIVTDSGVLLSSDDVVHLVNKQNGEPIWSRQFDVGPIIPAAATGEQLFVKSANRIVALNPDGGTTLWHYEVNDFISLPVVTGSHLYLVTRTGGQSQLRALDISSGEETWRLDSEDFANAAPIAAYGFIFARTIDGRILAFGE